MPSLLSPAERGQIVAPYPDYEPEPADEPPDFPTVAEIVTRMSADAGAAAAAGEDGRKAAIALVIAVGNYEWVSFQRQEIIDAAELLLDRLTQEPGQTRRWG